MDSEYSESTKDEFFNRNVSIKESHKTPTDSCKIGPDDEVWLLQCPRTINIDALINRKIKLPGKTHHEHLESVSEKFHVARNITLGTCNSKRYKLQNVPITGSVFIRERLKITGLDEMVDEPVRDENENTKHRVLSPNRLKIRHPLLGADYQEKIDLHPNVAARLKAASSVERKQKKIKRRNEGMAATNITLTTAVKIEQPAEIEVVKVKKEKKRKRDANDTIEKPSKRRKIKKEENVVNDLDLEWIKQF